MSRKKNFLLLLFSIALLAPLSAQAQARQRQTGARSVDASRFPGQDLGAKINAADRSLGSGAGEIIARGGGRITTQIVVSQNHTLRLLAGTYAPTTQQIPILLREGASLIGAGWDQTIILETPAKGQFTVVSAYNNSERNGTADSDINISDIQIRGANPGFDSAQQAISLGNCSRCTVDRVWINGTRSIGIQLGGAAGMGNWAEGSKVTNCLFTRVASQNLALVNGRNIVFENNRFLASGQTGGPGSSNIDLEPNEPADRIENVVIRNNLIDVRESEVPTTGNGILVQSNSGTTRVGPILIEGNTVIGGRVSGVVSNVLSNGIYVFGITMKDVTIRNNKVTRTGQSGLRIEGTRFIVTGNEFTDVGGGGIPGFYLGGVTDSRIENNRFTYTGNGPADGSVSVVGHTRNNVIRNNPGIGFP
jgi:hypothetical protein